MSLQVWLPLNGDLHNQGLSDINLTNTVTFATSGKIGASCLNSQLGWFAVPEMAGKKQMSFAYWVKLNTGTTTNWLDPFSWYSTNGTSDHRSRQEFYYYNSGGNTEAMTTGVWYYNSSNSGLAQRKIGQWYHYAFTIDYTTGITQFFVDGVLWKTTTNADTSHYVKGSSFLLRESSLDCSINDFRLYDHILSAKEVEELAKGLVLHYKLDNNGCGNENLYTGSYDFSGTWVNKANWTDDTNTYNGFLVKKRSGAWGGLAQNITCSLNDIFTISFWAKVDSGGNIQSIHRSNLGNVTTGLTILGGSFSSSTIWVQNAEDGTQWKRYWATVQIISSDITYLQWRIENSVANKNLYICGFKLEKGTAATSWCPAKTDALYSLYAANDTTVYDSSGYGNNGTITGNLSMFTPSPRYSVATKYPDSNCAITIGNLSTIVPAGIFTFNIWFKKVTGEWSSKSWETILGGPSGFEFEGKLAGSQNAYIHPYSWGGGSTSSPNSYSIAYTLDEWHMVTMVRTTSESKFYLDGVFKVTGSAGTIPSGNYFIGAWSSASAQNYRGYFSDARIYATALTPEQVKELYTTSMSIDSSGNIHARELVEL